MLKCAECGNTFDKDELYHWEETHGLDSPPYERWAGCPHCHSTSYGDAHECAVCGEYFGEDDDYSDGWCHECAKAEYTDSLGLDYILENQTLALDFIEYHYGIEISGSGDKTHIINIIMDEFRKLVKVDIELGRMSGERKDLKEYCLDTDLDCWIGFLNRKRKENQNEQSGNL